MSEQVLQCLNQAKPGEVLITSHRGLRGRSGGSFAALSTTGPRHSTTTTVSHVWALAIARIHDRGKCYSFDMHFLLSES